MPYAHPPFVFAKALTLIISLTEIRQYLQDHRFNFDGALVPALSLANGLTITQDFYVQQFEYYHVELEKFDMLLAEGAAAENYLEVSSNRNSFQNARAVTAHPDFGPTPKNVMFAEYVQKITPKIIEPIRRSLFKRAEILTGARRTADTDLFVELNGYVIEPQTPCKKEAFIALNCLRT